MEEDSPGKLIGKVILYTAVGFVVWLALNIAAWYVLRQVGFETDPVALIEALSTALAAAAVFGAGVLAVRELQEASTSRHLEILNQLFEDLNSDENIAARRWVYTNLPGDPETGLAALSEEGRDAMKRVLNSLDHVSFLTQPGWAPEDVVMPWINPMVVKSWEKVGPYVLYERERRGQPDYYVHAERLALRCVEWRKKHYGGDESKWVRNAL